MFIRQKPARRDKRRFHWWQRFAVLPRIPWFRGFRIESWNSGSKFQPCLLSAPQKTGAARAKQPLMCAGGEEVAAKAGNIHILVAESMNAIDDEHAAVRHSPRLVCGDDPAMPQPDSHPSMNAPCTPTARRWTYRSADRRPFPACRCGPFVQHRVTNCIRIARGNRSIRDGNSDRAPSSGSPGSFGCEGRDTPSQVLSSYSTLDRFPLHRHQCSPRARASPQQTAGLPNRQMPPVRSMLDLHRACCESAR